jgi:hypothetical protein
MHGLHPIPMTGVDLGFNRSMLADRLRSVMNSLSTDEHELTTIQLNRQRYPLIATTQVFASLARDRFICMI